MPKTTYHRDGTVTLWDVYQRAYTRSAIPSGRVIASLTPSERDRVYRHLVSDEDIRGLHTDAGTAGDLEGAALCCRALDGDRAARRACAEQILDMRAMSCTDAD